MNPPPQGRNSATALAAGRRGRAAAGLLGTFIVFWLANVWPGWTALPFLDESTSQVLAIFNASLGVSMVANVVNAIVDRPVATELGEIATSTMGIAVIVRLWAVFPFDFANLGFNGEPLARTLLVLSVIGFVISIAAQVAALLGLAARPLPKGPQGRPHTWVGRHGRLNS